MTASQRGVEVVLGVRTVAQTPLRLTRGLKGGTKPAAPKRCRVGAAHGARFF
jgi:hypothetical protein